MTNFEFISESPAETDRLGAAIAAEVPDGTVVALCGTLGAGKTRLVQAVAAACGIDRSEVTSPTFVLCQEYIGERTLYHFDVYRLKDDAEFERLGPEEYFDAGGVTLIEWADRVSASLPEERLEIHIEVTGDATRKFKLAARGPHLQTVLDRIAARISD